MEEKQGGAESAHPGVRTAFDEILLDARMARDFRRWKREALRSTTGRHPISGLKPGHYEACARNCEQRVRNAALKAEISLARDLRRSQVAA